MLRVSYSLYDSDNLKVCNDCDEVMIMMMMMIMIMMMIMMMIIMMMMMNIR